MSIRSINLARLLTISDKHAQRDSTLGRDTKEMQNVQNRNRIVDAPLVIDFIL